MAGVEIADGLARRLEGPLVLVLPPLELRGEAHPEQVDEHHGYLGMGKEGALHLPMVETVRVVVGQGGVAEADKGVGQRGFLAGLDALAHKAGINPAPAAQDLGVVQLVAQGLEALAGLLQTPAVVAGYVEVAQEVAVVLVADGQAVEAAHPDLQALEYLHHLGDEIVAGRVAHRELEPGLAGLPALGELLAAQIEPLVLHTLLIQPQQTGDALGRRGLYVLRAVEPDHAQVLGQAAEVVLRVQALQGAAHLLLQTRRGDYLAGLGQIAGAFQVKGELLHLQGLLAAGQGLNGVVHLYIGDGPAGQAGEGLVQRAGQVAPGQHQLMVGLHQVNLVLTFQLVQAVGQVHHRLGFQAHADEKIGRHVLLQPGQVFLGLALLLA